MVKMPSRVPRLKDGRVAAKKIKKTEKTEVTARNPTRGRRRGGTANGTGALVIVESPTKAKTIGKYLGAGYTVKATVGHLRDLPQRELGVDVEHGFRPKYVTIKEKAKTLAEIKRAAQTSSRVLLPTDPHSEADATPCPRPPKPRNT